MDISSHPEYVFIKSSSDVAVIFQHRQLQCHHGAEDSNDPDTEKALNTLPPYMWVNQQADVGLLDTPPVTFSVNIGKPVNIRQYSIKPKAKEGTNDTIEGLLSAGVIYPTTSPWNTPILPFPKSRWPILPNGT